MPIVFIFFFLYAADAVKRKLVMSPRAHHLGLIPSHISQMMPVFGHNLDGIRIELILRFGNQRHSIAPRVSVYALPMIDACNRQNAQIIEYRSPPAIVASLRQRPGVGIVEYLLLNNNSHHHSMRPTYLCGHI